MASHGPADGVGEAIDDIDGFIDYIDNISAKQSINSR